MVDVGIYACIVGAQRKNTHRCTGSACAAGVNIAVVDRIVIVSIGAIAAKEYHPGKGRSSRCTNGIHSLQIAILYPVARCFIIEPDGRADSAGIYYVEVSCIQCACRSYRYGRSNTARSAIDGDVFGAV